MSSTLDRETPQSALDRIQSGFSKNDANVIYAFAAAGVDPNDIEPRENVLTMNAWKAKGRRVGLGTTALAVPIFRQVKDRKNPEKSKTIPTTARLFHVSQTVDADAPAGSYPEALGNPALVKPFRVIAYFSDPSGAELKRPKLFHFRTIQDALRWTETGEHPAGMSGCEVESYQGAEIGWTVH